MDIVNDVDVSTANRILPIKDMHRTRWRREAENVLVYDTHNVRLFELNVTGARIWELCDGVHTVKDIIDDIESRFSHEKEAIGEILDFIRSLCAENLLILKKKALA